MHFGKSLYAKRKKGEKKKENSLSCPEICLIISTKINRIALPSNYRMCLENIHTHSPSPACNFTLPVLVAGLHKVTADIITR